ncbi:hypothetical protein ES703_88408 [subsurface metagenome]
MTGIPVFNTDVPTDSDYMTFVSIFDHDKMGQIGGEIMIRAAEQMNKELHVYEIWCPMSFITCVQHTENFNATVANHPLIASVTPVDISANYGNEAAMNAVMDTFPAHPELNAIWCNGGGIFSGIIEALQALDRYYPAGHPEHVVWGVGTENPEACQETRGGYIDGIASASIWAASDITAKAILTYVCLGQPIPMGNQYVQPSDLITPETIGDPSPYGEPMRWGDMLQNEPDITKWPVLDMEPFGMPTPTLP